MTNSAFLQNLHHAYARTDNTYAFPSGRVGDQLKQGMREVNYLAERIQYLTECTLATVEGMSSLKKVSKGEYDRQIAIAQAGIDVLKTYNSGLENRVKAIITEGITVKEWAFRIRTKWTAIREERAKQ